MQFVTSARNEASWQRELRKCQSDWRESRGLPIGVHKGHPLGSRLAMPAAEKELWNFLTPTIKQLALAEYRANRSRSRRDKKLLGYPRFFDNLLSSQPLAFNLFGELAADPERATIAARRLWPSRVERVTRIDFEWSPGRGDPRYLSNGTAADIAVFHTTPSGGNGVIFVETKYHEDLRRKNDKLKPRYFEVAQASHAFMSEQIGRLQTGSLQQLWFDHLLSLATKQTDDLESSLFVVLYPSINERCREAVAQYRKALSPHGAVTFETHTLEDVIEPLSDGAGEAWKRAFVARYLGYANATPAC